MLYIIFFKLSIFRNKVEGSLMPLRYPPYRSYRLSLVIVIREKIPKTRKFKKSSDQGTAISVLISTAWRRIRSSNNKNTNTLKKLILKKNPTAITHRGTPIGLVANLTTKIRGTKIKFTIVNSSSNRNNTITTLSRGMVRASKRSILPRYR